MFVFFFHWIFDSLRRSFIKKVNVQYVIGSVPKDKFE